MAKSKLFECAVIFHEEDTKDANQNVVKGKSVLVKEPFWILALNDKEVGMKIARDLPETYLDKLDQVEILIRPFN